MSTNLALYVLYLADILLLGLTGLQQGQNHCLQHRDILPTHEVRSAKIVQNSPEVTNYELKNELNIAF